MLVDIAGSLRVTLLNGFSIHLHGGREHALGCDLPHGVQRLVAHLCLLATPARTTIAGHLWPDVPEVQAHGSLRSALWRVQKLAPGLIEVSSGAVLLADRVSVDVRELSEWARRVLDPRAGGEVVEVPESGLGGDLLPGWYDDWVLLERERVHQLRMHALEALAGRLLAVGRHGEALQVALAAVRAEPLRESAHRTVVRVHLAEGNVYEALRAFRSFRAMIMSELGVEPTAQMLGLVERVHQPPRVAGPAERRASVRPDRPALSRT